MVWKLENLIVSVQKYKYDSRIALALMCTTAKRNYFSFVKVEHELLVHTTVEKGAILLLKFSSCNFVKLLKVSRQN
jgi:hypothetical protein